MNAGCIQVGWIPQNRSEFRNMQSIKTFMEKFWRAETGVTAIEYALITALVAVVIIAAVTLIGFDLRGMLNSLSGNFSN